MVNLATMISLVKRYALKCNKGYALDTKNWFGIRKFSLLLPPQSSFTSFKDKPLSIISITDHHIAKCHSRFHCTTSSINDSQLNNYHWNTHPKTVYSLSFFDPTHLSSLITQCTVWSEDNHYRYKCIWEAEMFNMKIQDTSMPLQKILYCNWRNNYCCSMWSLCDHSHLAFTFTADKQVCYSRSIHDDKQLSSVFHNHYLICFLMILADLSQDRPNAFHMGGKVGIEMYFLDWTSRTTTQ